MSASAAVVVATPLDALVADYLRVLANERGASVHTLRAYERELHDFAAWHHRTSTARRSKPLDEY